MVEIPIVCDTDAAGLGVLGVVIGWLWEERAKSASSGMAAYLAMVSFGIVPDFEV
jgi:hypothetical protein